MRKTGVIFGLLCLVLCVMAGPSLAGKPVDGDKDGYASNKDCNDSDATIYPGAPEICTDGIDQNCDGVPDDGCVPTTCNDNDGDGYGFPADATCSFLDEDCNDGLASVNPGANEDCFNGIDDNCDGLTDAADPTCMCTPAAEVCDNGQDDDCDGLVDGADPDCASGGPHLSLSWADYPTACMNCHDAEFNEMADSTHYNWVGETTEMVNQNGTQQGKLTNAVNSYCINILGDWKICGKCHVGRGLRPDDAQATNANIDCLMCHNADYAMVRDRQADGSMAPPAGTSQAVLDGYVQNISLPTRVNCLKCHANAGGGDAVKRGDLSMATISNSNASFDVHMNTSASDVQCQQCHVFQNHKTIGRGSDLRPTDDIARGSEIQCTSCHAGMDSSTGHTDAGANRTDADRHVTRVTCQACHIDEYAKVATEVIRDWRFHHDGSPADGVSGPGHPYIETQANLAPVYKFWNRSSDNYLLGDPAVIDSATGNYPTSRPLGGINDGKLYPFKYKTADQPMISGDKSLIALDTLVYIGQTGDVAQAIESGLQNMGYPASEPYEWVTTDTYQLLNHGVAPASQVDCSKCHDNWNVDSDNMLDKLGYKLKDTTTKICSQCHNEKRVPRDHVRMHGHLQKGSGIGCGFCHSFQRPERGLCSPCDPNCVSEFVDNIPYDHSDVCN